MNTSSDEPFWPDKLPWALRPFAYLILCIVVAPFQLAMLVGLGIFAAVGHFRIEREIASQMRLRGRVLSLRQLSEKVRGSPQMGTLLIERPYIGWQVTRAWWCSDEVSVDASYGQIFDRYLDPNRGLAFLLRAWNGRSIVRKVKQNCPEVRVVVTRPSIEWWDSQDETNGA